LEKKILLGHGSGGKLSHDLISGLFVKYFDNEILRAQTDSALLENENKNIAFTTDSYVIDPVFFPGGDIGKIAVCGTINDISVSGAKPAYLSSSFIIEEGFSFVELERIVKSMAEEAQNAGVLIVTGDTKVVDKGKCDKIFINTAGIGFIDSSLKGISTGVNIIPGDKILINGSIGDHGMAVLAARNDLKIHAQLESDCASLNKLISEILDNTKTVRFMRDATRGGLATVLTEVVASKSYGVEINENKLPVKESVRGMCELLGFDPLYVANEGKVVIIVSESEAEKVLKIMSNNELGQNCSEIGSIVSEHHGKGWLNTGIGGRRIIDMLSGEQLPRIC